MSKPAIIVDIEEQVSSFGDTMTGNLVLGSSSQSLIPTSGILVHDLRNCTITPHSFGDRLVNFYFNQSGTNGDWKSIIHMHGWTTSGYASWEIAGDAGGHIPASEDFCIRSGVDGTWNPWRKILHSGNYNNYVLPITGGTMGSGAVIGFTGTTGSISPNDPMTITYGRISCYGTLYINANTDNSGTEYVLLTAGKGITSSTADGLAIGTSTLTWQNMNVVTETTSKTWNINAKNDSNGYNINTNYNKRYAQTIDLTSYSTNTWYPVCIRIPYNGMHRIACVCQLNTGSTPSWGSHTSGFARVIEMLVTAGGWGTTSAKSICLTEDTKWMSDSNTPVGYRQFTNSSNACFYCRGGAKYILETDFFASWTVYTTSTTVSSETIAPVASYPGINFTKSRIYADLTGDTIYGAVWNDYAEYRQTVKNIKPGMVVIEQGDGSMQPSTDRLQPGGNIVSDTFGFAIGETDQCKTPLAVSGRALAYPAEDRYSYEPGDAVGTGPNGTVSKMTREEIMMYPERIIGTVSEIPEYERWGTGNVLIDGRIWIKVK